MAGRKRWPTSWMASNPTSASRSRYKSSWVGENVAAGTEFGRRTHSSVDGIEAASREHPEWTYQEIGIGIATSAKERPTTRRSSRDCRAGANLLPLRPGRGASCSLPLPAVSALNAIHLQHECIMDEGSDSRAARLADAARLLALRSRSRGAASALCGCAGIRNLLDTAGAGIWSSTWTGPCLRQGIKPASQTTTQEHQGVCAVLQ